MYEAKERVLEGLGRWGGVGVEFKWLLAPQVSHPGVLQRWEGSSRGSSLVLVLLLCNWLARVSAPLGFFLLGQEPEGWKDAECGAWPLFIGGGLHRLYLPHKLPPCGFSANSVFWKGCLCKWRTGVCHNCQVLQNASVNWLVESIIN